MCMQETIGSITTDNAIIYNMRLSKCYSCPKTECVKNPYHVCNDYVPDIEPVIPYLWGYLDKPYIGDIIPNPYHITCSVLAQSMS